MAEPLINVKVSLLSASEEALGSMEFQLPLQVMLDHPGPGEFERLVEGELMPEAVEATISGHMSVIPEDVQAYELNRIYKAVMKMYVNDDGEAMEFTMLFDR